MKPRLQALLARGDALTPRERTILFVLLLAGAWAVMDTLLMSPLERSRKIEAERIEAAKTRMQRAQDALAQQQGVLSPDQAALRRLEAARTAFNSHMQETSQLQGRMVAPKDMAGLLRGLTRGQPGLRLLGLQSLAPEPVGAGPEGVKPRETGLFKHGVTLTLSGSYDALVRYMGALEKLPAGFYWARAELDASRHPDLRLTLTLNTLSLEREWLTL